jgi:hypothetical protein
MMEKIAEEIFDILKDNSSKFDSLTFSYGEGEGDHNRDMFYVIALKTIKLPPAEGQEYGEVREINAVSVIKQEKKDQYVLNNAVFNQELLDELALKIEQKKEYQ